MSVKAQVRRFLAEGEEQGLRDLLARDRRVVPALNRLLFDPDELIRWRAIAGLGLVAREEPELLEKVIARLVWTMNDESGSIGWFAPEALGEICANDPDLVEDFFPLVISAMAVRVFRPGVIWAVGRVAPVRPDLVEEAGERVAGYLFDPEARVRGLAAWALGRMGHVEAAGSLGRLVGDGERLRVFEEGRVVVRTVGEMAREALAALEERGGSGRGTPEGANDRK